MLESPAQRALSAAVATLVVFGVCVAAFIPPLLDSTIKSLPLTILAGVGALVSMLLHFVFVGITAERMGRSSARWVTLTVVFFPIASIIGLILLGWKNDENAQQAGGNQ